MKKILLLLSMLMFIFTATVSAASAVFLKNQWYEPSEGTAEYVRVFTTDNPDYYRYINDRFAFAINLPANFNQAFESTNGDGCIFKDEYGSSFTVSGGHNMGMTLADEYDMDIQNHPSVTYKAKGDDWYVISYLENDRIYYKKCFINGEYWNTWYFDYPSWLADSYNNKCAAIESTFTPGWQSGRALY